MEQNKSITLSEEAQKAIQDLDCFTAANLDLELDEICVKNGFKLTKVTGSKLYLYYSCYMGGKVREIEASLKQREKKTKKCGKYFDLRM